MILRLTALSRTFVLSNHFGLSATFKNRKFSMISDQYKKKQTYVLNDIFNALEKIDVYKVFAGKIKFAIESREKKEDRDRLKKEYQAKLVEEAGKDLDVCLSILDVKLCLLQRAAVTPHEVDSVVRITKSIDEIKNKRKNLNQELSLH